MDDGREVDKHSTLVLSILSALLGMLSVAALLAWLFRLGSFARWFWTLSAPATALLGVVGVLAGRRERYGRLRTAMTAGALGGLAGTLGYDVFRLPFQALGLRLFAPIDSYGVLLLDAQSSSPWTGLAGWSYHFLNGIGFGVAFGILALGRRWWWAVLWGLMLESAAVLTPFAKDYGISNHWELIGLAYLAHVAYGVPLGLIVEHGTRIVASMYDFSARAMSWCLAALGIGLLLWHQPFVPASHPRRSESKEPATFIDHGRFKPEWLRVPPGGCVLLLNKDPVRYHLATGLGSPVIPAHGSQKVCFPTRGILRVRTSEEPYSGGFVIVDEEART